MLFSLDLPSGPYWLDLSQGVRVQVRPLSAAIVSAATSRGTREVLKVMAERVEREKLGVPADDLPDTDDPDIRRGLLDQNVAIGLARFGIMAWEGVGDAAGNAADCTADNREALGRHPLGLEFLRRYQEKIDAVSAEGNASAPTPPGGSAAAPNTAATAQPTTSAASEAAPAA